MDKQKSFPYPTPFEVVRYILLCLDLKYSDKFLDEATRYRAFDPRKLEQIITDKVSVVTRDTMGPKASKLLTNWLRGLLKNYMNFAANVQADALSRNEMLTILVKGLFAPSANQFLKDICKEMSGPDALVLLDAKQAVPAVLAWLEENEGGWKPYVRNAAKNNKEYADRIYAWKRGTDLPSSHSIERLQNKSYGPWPEQIDWPRVRILLFVARALDRMKIDVQKLMLEESSNFAISNFDMRLSVNALQLGFWEEIPHVLEPLSRLQFGLMRTKSKVNPQAYQQDFTYLRSALTEAGKLSHLSYWLDWQEARWQVFSGDLTKANELYKKAFTDALFRAGDEQHNLIYEALVVAASQCSPDKVFLKQLKWSLINFGYDIPAVTSASPSNKVSDTVEDWEMSLWRSDLIKMFPEEGLFPGVTLDLKGLPKAKIGPLVIDSALKIKPNYRSLNKKIDIGDTWTKQMPQLVWFAMAGQDDICEELIAKGAKVNVASDAGDTPLLIALLKIDPTEFTSIQPTDDRLFKLFSIQPGCEDIINQRTQKLRLLPIIQSVKSGRIDVVTKILELGADPNGRGETDEQTALNVCLKLISILKHPSKQRENFDSMPLTPEVLDAVRRYSQGCSGLSLSDQKKAIENNRQDPSLMKKQSANVDAYYERVQKHLDLNVMRSIACILIDSGADVNAKFVSPIKDYTSLMLAAEIDESDLFERMVVKGGNPTQSYVDPKTGQAKSCFEIAEHFGSSQVLRLLEITKP
jgi:hypothetical protein